MSARKLKEPEMTPFDGLLKHLADQFAPELLEHLGGQQGLISCEPVGGEVEVMHRLSDRVWRVTQNMNDSEQEYLAHIEFESSYKKDIERRIALYGWALYEKEGLPVKTLLWYVGSERPTSWPRGVWLQERQAEMVVGTEVISTIRWREVWLPGGYQASDFLDEAPPYLLPFAALMHGMEKPLLPRLRDAILGAKLSEERRQDLLAMAVFFACRTLKISDVMEVFDVETLEKNPFGKYLLEKGLEQGIEKGRQLGRAEGAKKIRVGLLSLLSRRLKNLPQDIIELLEECDELDVLSDLSFEIADMQDEDEILGLLTRRLGK